MTEETIILNRIAEQLSPTEWITFRRWARLGEELAWNTPISIAKLRQFKAELRQAVFDLWLFQHKDADHFSARIYWLIGKADQENLVRLSLGFPIEVLAWILWQAAPSEQEFFLSYDVQRIAREP